MKFVLHQMIDYEMVAVATLTHVSFLLVYPKCLLKIYWYSTFDSVLLVLYFTAC